MRKRTQGLSRRENAQGMVEFALVLPLLLLVIFGVIELGRLLAIYSSVATASREAARYASGAGRSNSSVPYYLDCNGIRSAAKRMAILAGISDSNIQITYDHGPSTTVFAATCPSTLPVALGDRVLIRVTAQYQPLLGLVNLPSFPISSQTSRTIVKDVSIRGTPPPLLPTNTGTPVPNTPPVVQIITPPPMVAFGYGSTILFTGSATDAQDGNISPYLRWYDGVFLIGTGASFTTSTLFPGEHTIIAMVTDSGGLNGSASVTIYVLNPPTPTNTATPTLTQSPTVTLTPTITLTHTPGPSSTPTDTPTVTPTPTESATPTPTPTDTPTPTPTPTNTSTATPTAVCPSASSSPSFGTGGDRDKLYWNLTNPNPGALLDLVEVTINWPNAAGNKVTVITFGGFTIYTNLSGALPPSLVVQPISPATYLWRGAFSTSQMIFKFNQAPQNNASGQSVVVTARFSMCTTFTGITTIP